MYLIEDFFRERNIYLIDKKSNKNNISLSKNEITNYLLVLQEFHNRVINGRGAFLLSIGSTIGKQYEWYNTSLKRIIKDYKNISLKENKNKVEEYFLNVAPYIINKAEESLNSINYYEYIDLIKRSMKNNEIILGSNSIDNITKVNDKIYLKDISNVSFNILESDLISFINKLNKKRISYNLMELIDKYIEIENLDNKSKKYIVAMVSYPIEFIKICEKIKIGKKRWSEDETLKRLKNSLKNIL